MSGIPTVSRLLTTKEFKRIAAVCGIVLLIGAGLVMRHYQRKKWEESHVFVTSRPIETSLGWGYEIVVGDTVYIHQEFIPAIQGHHGFRSKDDAMRVGLKIIEKMKHGQVEAVTVKDLKDLGIIDSIPASSIPTVRRRPDTVERLHIPK